MQIRPQESFPVLYQISDPSDVNTYYVRSVMRNSVTGAIIKINGLNFVNLTRDSGNSRRFSKTIEAPNDAAGFGIWIDIVTSVYTDSGYTTKSTVYEENIDKYLVQERWNISWGGGGGWGDWDKKLKGAIDYEKIGATVKNAVKLPEIEPVDLSPILESHDELKALILRPSAPKVDMNAVAAAIMDHISAEVAKLKNPKIDFSPLLKAIDKIEFPEIPDHPNWIPHFTEIKDHIEALKPLLRSTKYEDLMEDIAKKMTGRNSEEAPKENPTNNRVKKLTS